MSVETSEVITPQQLEASRLATVAEASKKTFGRLTSDQRRLLKTPVNEKTSATTQQAIAAVVARLQELHRYASRTSASNGWSKDRPPVDPDSPLVNVGEPGSLTNIGRPNQTGPSDGQVVRGRTVPGIHNRSASSKA
jgi:hypothetical protein